MSAARHWPRLQGNEKQALSSAHMHSASSAASLRKRVAFSIYPESLDHDLGEALDPLGKPICILPKTEILKQGLHCRSVAVLALSPENSLLLDTRPGPIFDVTCQGMVSAGMAIDEYAAWTLENILGMGGRLKPVSTVAAGSMLITIFIGLFSSPFLAARADGEFLLSHVTEINELTSRQLITPLLNDVLNAINP